MAKLEKVLRALNDSKEGNKNLVAFGKALESLRGWLVQSGVEVYPGVYGEDSLQVVMFESDEVDSPRDVSSEMKNFLKDVNNKWKECLREEKLSIDEGWYRDWET